MIPLKHPAAYWTANNPILGLSQHGFETDTGVLKQGDGVTAWNALAFVESIFVFSPTTGTDDYVTTFLYPKILGLFLGLRIRIQIANDNIGNVRINFNGFGLTAVLDDSGAQLPAGMLQGGGIYDFFYNGTNWQATAASSAIPASAVATIDEMNAGTVNNKVATPKNLQESLYGLQRVHAFNNFV